MIKDSTTLRRFAKQQLGDEYHPSEVTYKGREYLVFFEWCDDGEVDDNDGALNAVVQFEPCESRLGLSWHYAYYAYRKGDKIVLGDFDSHPNIEEDLEAAE